MKETNKSYKDFSFILSLDAYFIRGWSGRKTVNHISVPDSFSHFVKCAISSWIEKLQIKIHMELCVIFLVSCVALKLKDLQITKILLFNGIFNICIWCSYVIITTRLGKRRKMFYNPIVSNDLRQQDFDCKMKAQPPIKWLIGKF